MTEATASIDAKSGQISDAEAALYDRQIRLWGVEAQKKLRNANILIAGINGLGSEIVKNIVLSGVNSITLMDHNQVSKYDTTSNLFTNREIGTNRAESSSKRVQSLNPMVVVKYECANVADKDDDFFGHFDIVCLSGFSKEIMIKVNNICNKLSVKFYGVCSWGMFGFGFNDLGRNHSYLIEESIEGNVTISTEEPKPKKQKLDFVQKTIDYCPLETSLSVKAGKSGIGLTKRTPHVFIITHIMLAFHSKHSRFPMPNSRVDDIKELQLLQEQVLQHLGLDESNLKNCPQWYNSVFGELSPICAIIGGVMSQDMIRAVSAKDTPIRNFFLFNGIDYNGFVESVGK